MLDYARQQEASHRDTQPGTTSLQALPSFMDAGHTQRRAPSMPPDQVEAVASVQQVLLLLLSLHHTGSKTKQAQSGWHPAAQRVLTLAGCCRSRSCSVLPWGHLRCSRVLWVDPLLRPRSSTSILLTPACLTTITGLPQPLTGTADGLCVQSSGSIRAKLGPSLPAAAATEPQRWCRHRSHGGLPHLGQRQAHAAPHEAHSQPMLGQGHTQAQPPLSRSAPSQGLQMPVPVSPSGDSARPAASLQSPTLPPPDASWLQLTGGGLHAAVGT